MTAHSEQEKTYSQTAFDGLAKPENNKRVSSGYIQTDIFHAGEEQGTEFAETLVRIDGCQVINQPDVREWEKKKAEWEKKGVKIKQWRCTFVTPPDLWNQERSDWIQAVTENRKDITMLNKLKLNNGDMCTVIGIKTGERDEPMATGEKQRHITFVKVTEIIPGIRAKSEKANILQPKERYR